MKRLFNILLITIILIPICINASCVREGDKYRTDTGLLIDPDTNTGEFNYYCYEDKFIL